MLRFCLVVSMAFFAAWGGFAQDEEGLAQAFVQSLKVNGFDPIKFQLAAERMWEYGIREGDCDSLLNAEFLRREAWNYLDAPIDSSMFVGAECPDRPSPLYYSAAYAAIRSGDLEEASRLFEQAVEASFDEPASMQSMALQGLGSVQVKLRDYTAAIVSFERAYELVPDNKIPVHANNLAYVSYLLGQCNKSVEWANLGLAALQSINESDEFATAFEGELNALLLTQLQTAMVMGDSTMARDAAGRIRLDQPYGGRELAAMNILTRYAQWVDEPKLFGSYRGFFQDWILDLDSATVAQELGANRGLLESWSHGAEFKEAWDSLRVLPIAFRGGIPIACSPATNRPSVPWKWGMVAGFLLASLLLVGLVLAGAWMVRCRALRRLVKDATTKDLQRMVQQAIASDRRLSLMGRHRALHALGALIERHRKVSLESFPGSEEWTKLEREVAIGLINGEQSKELARRLHVSMSTIYNVRHGLRTRLSLGDEVSLGPWLRRQAAKGGAVVVGWISLVSFAAPMDGSQQLLAWFEANDLAGWQSHLSVATDRALEQAQREVPEGFAVFYERVGERPAWADVPDSVLWEWGRSGVEALHVMAIQEREGVDLLFDATLARERLVLLEWSSRRTALLWLLAVDGMLACIVLGMWLRGMARLPRFAEEWEVLRDAIEETGFNEEAELTLKGLLAKPSNDPIGHNLWDLLTTSEQEVARHLGQSMTVQDIAKRMACSPSYVYNLRSQIRQKWQLDAADNLVDIIHRVQSGEL